MPRLKDFIRQHTLAFGILTACIAIIALVFAWLIVGKTTDTEKLPAASAHYGVQSVDLPLTTLTPEEFDSVQSLSINGQLNVNNSIVLAPTNKPSNPLKGQLYYDGVRNALAYYNGSAFTSLADAASQAAQDGRIDTLEQDVIAVRDNTPTLPSDVALLGSNNTFSGVNLFDGSLTTKGLAVNGGAVFNQSLAVKGVTTLGATTISSLVLSAPLPVSSGGTGASTLASGGVVIANGADALSAVTASGADLCLISNATGAPQFKPCPGGIGSGVNSLNGLYGSLLIANTTAAGSTITINNASTTARGIAQFNASNFTVSSGVVDTVQNISTAATPTFSGLTVSSGATLGGALTLSTICTPTQLLTTNGSGRVICAADNTGTDTNTTYTAGNGVAIGGASNTISVNPQMGGGLNFVAGQLGLTTCTAGEVLKHNGTAWACAADNDSVSPGDGIGVTAVGGLDSQTKNSNGAAIYNNGGTLTIALQSADSTSAGIVTAGVQTLAGAKTFTGAMVLQNNFSQSGTATFSTGSGVVSLNGNVTIASGRSLTLGTICAVGQVLTTNGSGVITCASDSTGADTTYTAGNGIAITGISNTISVNPQANGGLSLATGQLGLLSCTAGEVLKHNGTAWACAADNDSVSPGDGIGVTAVGSLDGQVRNANGASIFNNAGTLTVVLQSANGTNPGLITAGAQTIGGAKTLLNDLTLQGSLTIASGQTLTLGTVCTTGQVLTTNGTGTVVCVTDAMGESEVISYTAGDGISITGGTHTIAVNPQTNGGLDFNDGQLGLVACTTDQILKYDGTAWVCTVDVSGVSMADGAGAQGVLTKFTSDGTIEDSRLSESGTTLTYAGNIIGNVAPDFSGNLLDLRVNGNSRLQVNSTGTVTANGLTAFSAVGENSVGASLAIRAGSGTGVASSGNISFSTASGVSSSNPVKDLTPDGQYFNLTSFVNGGSFSHTVTNGQNQILIVAISAHSPGANVSAVTYAGQSLTRIAYVDQVNSNSRNELWYLVNPPAGTSTISFSAAGYRIFMARAMTVSDVNTANPFGTPCVASALGQSASCVAATATSNSVLDIITGTVPQTGMGLGQEAIVTNAEVIASESRYVSMSYKAATGTNTINSYTHATNSNWSMISLPIIMNDDFSSSLGMQERLLITSSGNIGVNNLNPQYSLDITGDVNSSANIRTSGQVRISGTGDAFFTTLQVGATSVNGTLTVTELTSVWNIIVNGHIITAGGEPTAQVEAAMSDGTVEVEGTDTVGTITIATGATPTAGELARIVFSEQYSKAPRVVLSPSNEAAADFAYYRGVVSLTDFILNAKTAPAAYTTYVFDYFIAE